MNSHFHATIKNASNIKEGIRWIRNAPSCCQIVKPGANESAANKLKRSIARIQIIRGVQCNALIDVFIWGKVFRILL